MQSTRKRISEILASIAFIMLAIYLADVLFSILTSQNGFLPLSSKDRGLILGGSSIALFIISFFVGLGINSKILTTLLIIGGAIIGSSVLVSTYVIPFGIDIPDNLKIVTPTSPQFIAIIIIGYVIMTLGIIKGITKK